MTAVPTFDEVMRFTRTVSSNAAFEDPECKAYYDLLCSLPDHATVLEVGLQYGRSSSIVAQVAKAKRFNYIGVDPFYQPPEAAPEWIRMMQQVGVPFTLFMMTTAELWSQIERGFVFLPVMDLLLIDGDHDASGVETDLDCYVHLVPQGGYACFHDYGRDSLPDVYPTVNRYFERSGGHPRQWEQLPSVGTLGIFKNVTEGDWIR